MAAHTHELPRTCICYLLAQEPDEKCPIHGGGEWPPRCAHCGRFMPWPSVPATTAPSPD